MGKNALILAIGKGSKDKGFPGGDHDEEDDDMHDSDEHDNTDEERDLAQTIIDSKDADEVATALKHFMALVESDGGDDDEGDDE